MSSDELRQLNELGNTITRGKYYTIATTTVFFYDFFLTLPDEIKYAWHGRKSWVFGIFLANRYLPIAYEIWLLYTAFSPVLYKRLYECDSNAPYDALAYVGSTLLAQVVLSLRIYAVTNKDRVIASCFCTIMIAQFVLGLYLIGYTATTAQPPSLPIYMGCVLVGFESLELGLVAVSILYDLLAFSLIIYLVMRSNVNKVPIPRLLKIIARDATYYFLFIFAAHIAAIVFLLVAIPRIKVLPAGGTVACVSVMITRLLLSLKKADASREYDWSLEEITTHTTMGFAGHRGVATRDEILLDTFASAHEGTRGRG